MKIVINYCLSITKKEKAIDYPSVINRFFVKILIISNKMHECS